MKTIQERLRDVAKCWMHQWFDLTARNADDFKEAADEIDRLIGESKEQQRKIAVLESLVRDAYDEGWIGHVDYVGGDSHRDNMVIGWGQSDARDALTEVTR